MNVLYLIDSVVPSGAEQSLLALAPHYLDAGVRLEVAYLHDRPGLQRDFERLGVPLHCLDGSGGRLGWMRRTRRLVARRRPDLLHTTLFEADLAGRLAAWSIGTPVVSSLVNAMYGPEQFGNPDLSSVKLRLAHVSDAATAHLVTRFHAISRHLAEVMSHRLMIDRSRIDVISRGRDAVALGERTPDRRMRVRKQLGIPPDAPLMLSVARQEYQKGLTIALEAFAAVRARFSDALFVIAGREGNATLQIHDAVRRLRLAPSVRFLGPRDDVPDLMSAADVLMISSLFEGLGGTAIEALALELPIVTSDLPAVREVVGDGEIALLVPPGDARALAYQAISVLEAPAQAARRAAVGRRRFIEQFTIQSAAKGMLDFYDRALDGRRHAGRRQTSGGALGRPARPETETPPRTIPSRDRRERPTHRARPVRVTYVIDSLVAGGAERSLAAIAPMLVRNGVDLTVAYLRDGVGVQDELTGAGATLVNLSGGAGRAANARRIAALLHEQKPDLVHTTLFEADLAGRLASLVTLTPVVSTLPAAMYDWEHVHDPSLKAWRVHAAHAADLATAQLVRRFHAVSCHVADAMARRLAVPHRRIQVIPRGRNPEILGLRTAPRAEAARHGLGIDGATPVVLAAARHEHKKGLDVLLEAFARVRSEVPSAQLVVAGREGVQTPRLRELSDHLGLNSSVHMLGARNDVAELLTAADAFVLSSVSEGFPGALLEAMALQAPIVSTDLPATREVLGSDEFARLVPPRRPDLLAQALVETLLDRSAATERADAARKRFMDEFSVQSVAERMVDFYAKVLDP